MFCHLLDKDIVSDIFSRMLTASQLKNIHRHSTPFVHQGDKQHKQISKVVLEGGATNFVTSQRADFQPSPTTVNTRFTMNCCSAVATHAHPE